MNSIDKLITLFSEFPGIGPKQARRFVYFLINKGDGYIEEFKKEITDLKKDTLSCSDCKKFFLSKLGDEVLCTVCKDKNRENDKLLVVSRDVDSENIEKTNSYNGKYFILGGVVPILDKNPEQRIKLKELLALVSRNTDKGLKEIILALDANSEGEYTAKIIKQSLSPILEKYNIKISEFGRGLSTGTELEYSDPETIKNALKNRN